MNSPSVLAQPALVLNESWSAIHTVTVRHALRLMFTGAAKAVVPHSYEVHGFDSWTALAVEPDEPHIKTVRLKIKVPEVILLTHYAGQPNPAAVFSRRNLFRRDHNQCQYCGVRPGTAELSIDHIFPRSRGGKSSWENCVLACTDCNRTKRDRTPEEAGMRLLKRPDKPKWSPILEIPLGRVKHSWSRFVSDAYWDVRLEP
ncbi:MAG: HNH endonuclease [Planctomycetes bacterium]|nr:HNH endonuclease [Planctomycetota bacterium]